MTYNIRHGLGNHPTDLESGSDVDLTRIANVIRQANPDVIALQEVDRGNPRSGWEDQPAVLGEMLGMESCYGANVVYDEGEYGVAILSRFPILAFQNTALPTTDGWEVRGVLEARIRLSEREVVTIFNTHLQVGHEGVYEAAATERAQQAGVVAHRIASVDGPAVLIGDFNAQLGDEELEPFANMTDAWIAAGDGGPGFTIPSHSATSPDRRIDVIYVGDGVSQVLSLRLSELPLDEDVDVRDLPAVSAGLPVR